MYWKPSNSNELDMRYTCLSIQNTIYNLRRLKYWKLPTLKSKEDKESTTLKIINTWIGGWRDGSAIKSTGCSVRGPKFNSQQPYGGSQPSVMRSNGLFWCVWRQQQCTQIYIHIHYVHIHMQEEEERREEEEEEFQDGDHRTLSSPGRDNSAHPV